MFTIAPNQGYSVRHFVSKYSQSKRAWRHLKRAAKKSH